MFQLPFLDQLRSVVSASSIDEFSDMLSCFASASIYLFGAILISAKTYVGSPIECWFQQTYSSEWAEYAETYCFLKFPPKFMGFIQNTYFFPDKELMNSASPQNTRGVPYYQWSSMYLGVMAMVFVIPKILWSKSQAASDIPLTYFCETAHDIRIKGKEQRKEKIEEMAEFMMTKIRMKNHYTSFFSLKMHNYYFATKILYIAVWTTQFVLIALFLGMRYNLLWGYDIFANLVNGITWEETGIFPRITYCTFQIRQIAGDNHPHNTQCVLGVNEFNEKIFVFIWFWLVFLGICSILGLFVSIYTFSGIKLVRNLVGKSKDIEMLHEFERYLTLDGKIILSFVKTQSDIVAHELAGKLWEMFNNHHATTYAPRIAITPRNVTPNEEQVSLVSNQHQDVEAPQ